MNKCYLSITCFIIQIIFIQIVHSSSEIFTDYSNLRISKALGSWELGKDHGYYRVVVLRIPSREHSSDHTYVQIVKNNENGSEVLQTIEIESPGYKGYVENIELNNIAELNTMVVSLDIKMKAMADIVMREIYLVSANGKIKALVQAKYSDIYDE